MSGAQTRGENKPPLVHLLKIRKETVTGVDILTYLKHNVNVTCLVVLFIANELNHLVKKQENQTEFMCTPIHFSLFNQPRGHESSSGGKTVERWISSLRPKEKITETYWN